MGEHAVLLRGINLGSRNRISMPELREALKDEGFGQVRTYLQSGNAVVASPSPPDTVARTCEKLIAKRFGLEIAVLVRSRAELARIVKHNPLAEVATNPKRYQVTFLADKLDPKVVGALKESAVEPEQVVVKGREVYAWHPEGVARSRLWNRLAGKSLGVTATSRNWATVETLLELMDA